MKIKNLLTKKMKCPRKIKKSKLPASHRSTTYPCFVPNLGGSAGADRAGLANANIRLFFISQLFCLIFLQRRLNSYFL